MLKLKHYYFGRLKWRADSEKTLMLGKIEGRRRRGWQSSGRWWRTGKPGMLWSTESQRATEQQLHQHFCFTWHFYVAGMASLLNLMNEHLLASNFSSVASSPHLGFIELKSESESEICSSVSDSLQPHWPPWNSPGQNTWVGSLSLLQGIFPTQGSNPGLPIAGRFFTSWTTREAS